MKNFLEIYLKQIDNFLVNESNIDSNQVGVGLGKVNHKKELEKLYNEFGKKKNLFNEIKNYVENKDKEATAQQADTSNET